MQKTREKWPLAIKSGGVTVKVYQTVNRGRPLYTVAYHEGGERRLRQFAAKSKARTEAKDIARKLNAGLGDALELTGKDRDAYLFALRKLKSLGIGLASAIEEFVDAKAEGVPLVPAAKLYRKTHLDALPVRNVSEVVEELLAAKKTDGASEAYLAALKSYLNSFARDFKTQIGSVQTSEIDAWLRSLDVSPRSRNNNRNTIILLFNFAKAGGYLPRDASTAADATSLARKKESEIEIFSPSEMIKLLAAGDDTAVPFFALGGFVGLRSAEIGRLKWEDINWHEKVVEVRASVAKTRTRRLPPLTPAAIAWLSPYKNRKGLIIPTPDTIRGALERAADDSGVKWKKNALRHSYGTYRMAVLKDPVRVAFEMGNSPGVIRQCYDRVVTEAQGNTWFSIMPKGAANVISMEEAAA